MTGRSNEYDCPKCWSALYFATTLAERARARQERESERKLILDELIAISTEAHKLRSWLDEAKHWPRRRQSDEFNRFVEWARERLEYLDHAVDPDGIAREPCVPRSFSRS